jgi:rhamnosyltransferase
MYVELPDSDRIIAEDRWTFRIVIPTLNAAADLPELLRCLSGKGIADRVLLIDSSSSDETLGLAHSKGIAVVSIPRDAFDHGGTRQLATEIDPNAEILIYLTQDAYVADLSAIDLLLEVFRDPLVAAAYGRQLPREEAGPIEAHARFYNYSAVSSMRSLESRQQLGFKAIFISNSFAAYRVSALHDVGGFPRNTIFGEDTITAAKLLKGGWKIAYVADAKVRHSHPYTWKQEFCRYFDIGVLHARESWLLDEFGGASGEGARFVRSELRFLWPRHWWLIPSALVRTSLKLMGYKLGRIERYIPIGLKRNLSMNRGYWK